MMSRVLNIIYIYIHCDRHGGVGGGGLLGPLVVDPLKEYHQKPKNAAKTLFSGIQMPQRRYSGPFVMLLF